MNKPVTGPARARTRQLHRPALRPIPGAPRAAAQQPRSGVVRGARTDHWAG